MTTAALRRPLEPGQYTAVDYRKLCSDNGTRQSMGATGVSWDNAAAEAFIASMKRELVNRYRWLHRADARQAIIRWTEGWYNARRLHSTLRYRTPVEAEHDWYRHQETLAA